MWSTVGGLPLLLDDGDHAYLYGPSLSPVAQVDGSGTVEYLHWDVLGSVRTITDSTGAVVGASTFDAFGSRTAHTGTADSDFGFTGNWTDPDTGLVHLRARDYDPATGQFLTVDPAVDSTRQPYAYTGNGPLNRTDPSGLDWGHEALVNIMTLMMSYGDGLSFGLSNNLYDSAFPGMRCALRQRNPDLYNGGSFGGTVAFNIAVVVATWGFGAGVDALIDLILVSRAAGAAGATIAAGEDVIGAEANAAGSTAGGLSAQSLSAQSVRFSQSSVNDVSGIEASMSADGWVGDAIDVVRMPDGGLTSLDNTRLLAAQRAGIDVQATIHGFDDALPSSLIERFTTSTGSAPSTWGDAIMNRIGNQNGAYRASNPYGSWVTGWGGN